MSETVGAEQPADPPPPAVPLGAVLREWGRIGVTGFGGPPTHIALFKRLVVDRHGWLSAEEFESAVATCNLLPGPASTQLSMYCAYRVAGRLGGIVGGLAFIVPAVVIVLLLSLLFLSASPPLWIRGAGDGAGGAVAAVAAAAAAGLLLPSWRRARLGGLGREGRWFLYAILGAISAALVGPYLVLVLLACGLIEMITAVRAIGLGRRLAGRRDRGDENRRRSVNTGPVLLLASLARGGAGAAAAGGLLALTWEAFKVGALSYGGGFVIIPLMQHDAVDTYHWMTAAGFLNAVALGQVSPGPVVATVAAVGYAAHGIGGGALAAAIAFLPSFAFVLIGGPQFARLRRSVRAQAFLDGAGPAAIGAIAGSAIPLAGALREGWQVGVLAAAAVALLLLRRGVVETLVGAGAVGVVVALAGGPV